MLLLKSTAKCMTALSATFEYDDNGIPITNTVDVKVGDIVNVNYNNGTILKSVIGKITDITITAIRAISGKEEIIIIIDASKDFQSEIIKINFSQITSLYLEPKE